MADTWVEGIEAAVVTVLTANADMIALFKLTEAGVPDPLVDQEFLSKVVSPYCGIVASGFSADVSAVAHMAMHDVAIQCGVIVVDANQKTAKTTIQQCLSTLAYVVANEKHGNAFSYSDATGELEEVLLGSGRVINVTAPQSDRNDTDDFILYGIYDFRCQYRMKLQ